MSFLLFSYAEKSAKLIQDISLRSSSSRSSSCKSLALSNSKNSSPWTEFKNDLFDDYGGMDSGSHSLTLGRLYAWEKKLYEEVKVTITEIVSALLVISLKFNVLSCIIFSKMLNLVSWTRRTLKTAQNSNLLCLLYLYTK